MISSVADRETSPAPPSMPETIDAPRIIADHARFLAIHKPAQWLIHPTRPDGKPTLLDWLQLQRPGQPISLVNRLDRETSGLVLAALDPETASRFGKMMMNREIQKDYLALVHGRVEKDHDVIDAPLGRIGISDSNPIYIKQGVLPDGAASRTEYWLEKAGHRFSLLRLRAHTGRLHQLRAHLAHLGHPVVGDKIYGPDPQLYLKFIENGWTPEHADKLLLPRHALHAAGLRFTFNEEPFEISDPLPGDLQELIDTHFDGALPAAA
jgi:23S rRNA pseudouridine1911/1915/1917 synthase